MKGKLITILASSLYLFSPSVQPEPNKPDKPAVECPKRNRDLSQLEKELTGYGYKLYSHSARPSKAKIILVGYNPLDPDGNMAAVLASYVQDNDIVLLEGRQKGEDLRARTADIPALRCLQGRNIKTYGATHDVKWYKEFLEDLEVFEDVEAQHTAFTGVMRHDVSRSREIQEEEYSKLIRESAKSQEKSELRKGKVYAVIDYEYVTNGRFTLNLKRDGIKFAAVSPPYEKLEEAVAEGVENVMLSVRTEGGEVTLPYNNFTVRGSPLTIFEAIVIAKGNVEYSGDEKIKYLSDTGKEVSLPRGKKYSVKRKEIIDKE